ncbi:MAG: flagellar biosynthetic protein FliR [Planctomycetes bacterium]|nr:flagellar biosynthetic protein FliR [Planctomycetota bacterium]
MEWLNQLDPTHFVVFTLVLCRVSGLVMVAPIYGTKEIPVQVRALLAFSLALLIVPGQWNAPVAYPGNTINYLVFVGGEFLLGLVLGMGVVILFSGIRLAGLLMGRIGGLMLADVFDPNTETSTPLFAQMLRMLALAIFVCVGGHRLVMAGLLDTFETIPLGSGNIPTAAVCDMLVTVLSQSFSLGIRAAAPVVTALLLSTLVMGLISRTMPQLNIMAVGFGMNSMITLGTLFFTIGAAAWIFQAQLTVTLETILDALHVGVVPPVP